MDRRLDKFGYPTLHEMNRFGNYTLIDKVPDDIIHLIDSHWYQFPPLNPMWHGIFGIFLSVTAIVAWTGNFAVFFIFSTTKSLRTPSNLFVVNLAVSDFALISTLSPPMVICCYYEFWALGQLGCDLYGMFGSLFGCASIWSMTMIALDRYNVIVKGLSGKPLTITGAILRIILIWLFSTIWTFLPIIGWNRYVPEGNLLACGTDYLSKDWISRSYIIVYSFFVYFLPLGLIIYSYYFILKTVTEHEKSMREQAKKMNVTSLRTSDDANKNIEAKLAKIALVTISLWFVAWTPYLLINYTGIFELYPLSPITTIWGSIFAKCNSMYNPIVYAISHPKYKVVLYEKLPWLSCGPGPISHNDNQSQATVTNNENNNNNTA